jgi:Caspase domain
MATTFQLSAVALALLCAGMSSAQAPNQIPPSRSIADDRNLSVQRVANPQPRISSQRIALVIGNASYKDAPLTNPVNDARAIAKALSDSGFTVILRENADQRGILGALREFGDKLRAGGTGLFYYAGHGMQIKGRNYLIPVGASIEREDEVAYSAVDAQAVLDKMEAAGNGANIMILDACRNNPFTRSTRSGQAGLAQMDAPVGTLVAFATSPGAVASDGAGSNGLYTQHLLEAMRKEGSKVEDVFKQVRANVRRDSLGKQVPWEATSLEGDFYFRGGAAGGGQQLDLEQALWDAVKDSKEPIELRAYLNRYPQGRFSQLARERLSTWSTVNQTTNQPTNAAIRPPVAGVATNSKTDNNQRAKEAVDQLFNLPPPNTTSQRPASSSTTDDLQAAVDQRTKELLDQLSNLPRPNTASTKSGAASSANGFTVGDRWRFQTVDKYKKEVVENWARQIERIEPDGSMRLNSGRVQWSSTGGLQRTESASGRLRTYSPEIPSIPRQLQNGWQQAVKFTLTWRNEDSQYGVEEREGKLTVLGRESVTVPAGTFDAWKVEMAGDAKGKNLVSNSNYYSTFKEVWWYVPALRYFVASEYEQRRSGQLESYVRYELTSYSVRGADEALAKR